MTFVLLWDPTRQPDPPKVVGKTITLKVFPCKYKAERD